MREKFEMKNVASKTDRALFTVWVKVGFPVGMITQCVPPMLEAWRRTVQHTNPKRKRGRVHTVSTVLRVSTTLVNRA